MRGLCDVWPSWHGPARHGTARTAPASRGASQRHPGGSCAGCATHSPPPLAPASPPFAVAVSACGVAISACGVLTFRNTRRRAHPPTEGARAAAGSTTEMKALPSELIHRIAPRPSPVGACTAIRVESSDARANASPLRSIEPGSEKKNAPRAATSEKARNALRTLRFRATAPAAAGSESRSATVCSSAQFKSKASVSFIKRAASEKHKRTLMVQDHHG